MILQLTTQHSIKYKYSIARLFDSTAACLCHIKIPNLIEHIQKELQKDDLLSEGNISLELFGK
jgi:hypothetical protein